MALTTTTNGGGATTSFSNTPQAKGDTFLQSEDFSGVALLAVLANDLGGNAKTLWSLDNSVSASTATKSYAPADLLAQDTARAESTSSDTSLYGARIWITEDGKVGYDAATLTGDFQTKLQNLAVGETMSDTFTYAIRLGNGTLSWATATVQYAGANDIVSVTSAQQTGTVVEDANTTSNPSQAATGTITFTDVDASDTHAASFVAGSGNSTPLGTFSLDPVSEAANATNGSVAWNYVLNNAAAQYLAAGQTVTETYVVTISDGHGSTASQTVTITITGSNDQVLVSGAVDTGAVVENGTAQASGTVSFTDVDLTDNHRVTSAPESSNYSTAMGSFSVVETTDTTGSGTGGVVTWTYDINAAAAEQLANGQVVTEVHRITINDNQGDTVTQDVTITITGSNDGPVVDLNGAERWPRAVGQKFGFLK